MLKGRPVREIIDIAVLCFVVACVLGTFGEQLWHGFGCLMQNGQFVWESRSGLIYGPFAPLYGVGVLIGLFAFGFKGFKAWQCFLIGALLGGVFEFLVSLWQELCFGTRSWDYSGEWDSIGGRTRLLYMLIWGLIALLLAKVILPWFCKIYDKLPKKPTHIILSIVLVLLVIDSLITIVALSRQSARHEGIEASNGFEQWVDDTYPDERINAVFQGTSFIKDKNNSPE